MDEAVKFGQNLTAPLLCLLVGVRCLVWVRRDWDKIRAMSLRWLVLAVIVFLFGTAASGIFYAAMIAYPHLRDWVPVRVLLGIPAIVAALFVTAAQWQAEGLEVAPRLIRCGVAFLGLWALAACSAYI